MAVWSLVTGILLVGPVAVVLAVLALRRIRRRSTRGRGLAIAGLVLGAISTVALLAAGVVGVLTWTGTRPLPSDVGSARDAHAQQLVTGNCLASLPADGRVDTVRVAPCAESHAAQVVTVYEFLEDSIWPGQRAVDARVARSCVLDQAELDAGVTAVTWAPTEQSWSRGDRTGLCLAVVEGGGVTGSFLDDSAQIP
ncbi:DUF4190 domain-containing protein [Cellulomonas sp. URHE0023]|uniref:DUF4190 domain-containing protein n=1 Tax=Cellulomonas sp. URHE0023 TaxID=1380354 RepID=UPI001E3EAF4D|nr:DUF4190 domain-containing protein [Cellulomonas sp. URHE0023]